MPLRIIRPVQVDSNYVYLGGKVHPGGTVDGLAQLYSGYSLRLRILRHFDRKRVLFHSINETTDGRYSHDSGLILDQGATIARRFAILSGHWLEVVVTHAKKNLPGSDEEQVFPGHDVIDLAFDPDET